VIEFNLNNTVLVRLTEYGRFIDKSEWQQFVAEHPNVKTPYTPPKEDAQGRSRWQLWRLMRTFGPYISLGADLCFETDMILENDEPTPARHVVFGGSRRLDYGKNEAGE